MPYTLTWATARKARTLTTAIACACSSKRTWATETATLNAKVMCYRQPVFSL